MKRILVIFLFAMLFSACKKDYRPNILTKVTGKFYDSLNNEPYVNFPVKVGEYQSKFELNGSGTFYFLKSYVGSGTTDFNGNYYINFTTTGKGNSYFLEWGNTPADVKIINPDRTSTNGSNQSKVVSNIGGSNVVNVYVSKQYYMKVRFIVHDNPLPPLNISAVDSKWSRGWAEIYGKNNDTTVYIQVVKNEAFRFTMDIYDPKRNVGYWGTPILFNNTSITRDTTQGGTYDIYPATFK